jgi:hypothetical protein
VSSAERFRLLQVTRHSYVGTVADFTESIALKEAYKVCLLAESFVVPLHGQLGMDIAFHPGTLVEAGELPKASVGIATLARVQFQDVLASTC